MVNAFRFAIVFDEVPATYHFVEEEHTVQSNKQYAAKA